MCLVRVVMVCCGGQPAVCPHIVPVCPLTLYSGPFVVEAHAPKSFKVHLIWRHGIMCHAYYSRLMFLSGPYYGPSNLSQGHLKVVQQRDCAAFKRSGPDAAFFSGNLSFGAIYLYKEPSPLTVPSEKAERKWSKLPFLVYLKYLWSGDIGDCITVSL